MTRDSMKGERPMEAVKETWLIHSPSNYPPAGVFTIVGSEEAAKAAIKRMKVSSDIRVYVFIGGDRPYRTLKPYAEIVDIDLISV